ncbi:hypothetical protein WJX81_007612 [Elliptochloris bilobata]|uniref:Hikeshi-like C-terminal domain-containing protein n=1 Tax=Elliptochloris bilobata TaxID=381761 RepID=A0AAW1S903_9CHLO
MSAGSLFGALFIGHSFPIADSSFVRVDATHWVFDVGAVGPQSVLALKEVAVFLTQPLPDAASALGVYVSVGGVEWHFRGYVANSHPSEVMPLQWPEPEQCRRLAPGPGVFQLGVSVEPLAEVAVKEGSKLVGRQEYAKRVALDLYRFMESFNVGVAGDRLVLPTNVLEQWFVKFDQKFKRDPDFLLSNLGDG